MKLSKNTFTSKAQNSCACSYDILFILECDKCKAYFSQKVSVFISEKNANAVALEYIIKLSSNEYCYKAPIN